MKYPKRFPVEEIIQRNLEKKESIVESIKNRILAEYRKHKRMEYDTWAELAALKIYFTHIDGSK